MIPLKKRMKRSKLNSFYDGLTDSQLFGTLLTEGDRLPRDAVDTIVQRGAVSIGAMTAIIEEEKLWRGKLPEWWAPLHAVHILGAIGGEIACAPLAKAIRLAEKYDNEWIIEVLPPIIGAMPLSIVEDIKKIVTDKKLDWFTRIHAAEGLAAMTLRHHELEDDIFRFLGDIFLHNDDDDMRDHVACILMDFQRREYFDSLCERGRGRDGFGVVFTEDDVKRDFSKKEPDLSSYTRDWLSFYHPQEIAKRQKRWAEEDDRRTKGRGKVLDGGMCICACCGEKKKIGGFIPVAATINEGVRCVDCMNVLAAEQHGINVEEATLRREKMLETTRLMNRICIERYLKECGKEEFESIVEANTVLQHVVHAWNSLSTEERKRVEKLPVKEQQRYFKELPIDFKSLIHIGKFGKPGRNDPCLCGSGKKFKKCCLQKLH